jgi:hypothetical protein
LEEYHIGQGSIVIREYIYWKLDLAERWRNGIRRDLKGRDIGKEERKMGIQE